MATRKVGLPSLDVWGVSQLWLVVSDKKGTVPGPNTETNFGVGGKPFAWAVKLKLGGFKLNCAGAPGVAAVTMSVTGMVAPLLDAPAEVTAIWPT